jgi:transposase
LERRGGIGDAVAMSDTAPDLPDDIDALRALVLEQRAELALARSGLVEQRYEIEALKGRLARLLRAAFGQSSEKLRSDIEQLEFLLADQEEQAAETDTTTEPKTDAKDRTKPVRAPLPAALPRAVIEYTPPCNEGGGCPACGGRLHPLGTNETEILDYISGGFHVVRHVRPKLSCRSCETILQAPAPELAVRRGRAGAGLLAHVAVAKYCDHQPLHRQAEQYARADIDLSRSTLADMIGQTAALPRPLLDALARHVLSGARLHADDTTVPVLAPGLGRTKTGRIWTYVRDDRPFGGTAPVGVFYRYIPDRKGEHPRGHLAGFTGILQADGYAGFAQLYTGNRILEAACLAHARRKFFDLFEATKSPLAKTALEKIAALYRVETEIRGQPPDDRLRIRRERGTPLFADLKAWLQTTLGRISGRSDMAKAIRYSLSRWQALTTVLRDGRACIDNSAAERAMRPVALGRRNWTFAGSDRGGERAAVFYSLIETAKMHGLDPEAYLTHVLERIASHPVNRVADLLPWNVTSVKPRLDQRLAA